MFNSNLNKVVSVVSDKEQTIISFLKDKFCSTPISLIHKLFRTKKVLVNSIPVRFYQHRIKKGSEVVILDGSIKHSNKKKFIKPVDPIIDFTKFYEDENVIIVIKEHGIETHNKKTPSLSLDNSVSHYLFYFSSFFNVDESMIVSSSHRIDKLTKGLVVYAKNPESKRVLHKSFGDKDKIKKKYIAVCKGSLKQNWKQSVSYSIEGYIHKEEKYEKMVFDYQENPKDSKKCSMLIERIFSNGNYHIFEITLKTGRKHQIRSFFSYVKMPIIGDKKYCSEIELSSKIKLFAYYIKFSDLPDHLSYLNGKEFQIPGIKKLLISQISSVKENVLPKKFIRN